MATGSEVHLATQAQERLWALGIDTAVVSIPCMEHFNTQDVQYQKTVLGDAPRIGIEAGVDMPWYRYLGENGHFIGMHSFGASAPAPILFEKFGITVQSIVDYVVHLTEKGI
jgi:transketolase